MCHLGTLDADRSKYEYGLVAVDEVDSELYARSRGSPVSSWVMPASIRSSQAPEHTTNSNDRSAKMLVGNSFQARLLDANAFISEYHALKLGWIYFG